MSVERPTFSELWFRVAQIRARLRTVVQIGRQDFRGHLWYVVQDDTSNQYYRLSRAAYEFVARLDGERTVSQVWMMCCEEQGDEAVTQPEVIQLLGNLYSANLLQADIPPDAAGLFQRYQTRTHRELTGMLSNFLFLQIPVLDPNVFLDRTRWLLGRLFTWYGGLLWLVWVAMGAYCAILRAPDLFHDTTSVLDPNNIGFLYLSFVGIKMLHELGHAVACKKFGVDEGKGGEVHSMGVMLMVGMPFPYVDASSAWALRNKWSRILVGAAGMIVELAIASGAAIVWSRSAPGSAVHAITYNMMFVSSVSTILFNGNPLLRYDAYYMLSDFLEIPNLNVGARDYVYHLVRRYVWGMKLDRTPVTSWTERFWLFVYFFASTAFRVMVSVGLFWSLANRWFIVGALLAAAFVVGWTIKPAMEFGRYLASNRELEAVRLRAIVTSLLGTAAVFGLPLLLVTAEHTRLEGIAEPRELAMIHSKGSEFLTLHLETGSLVKAGGAVLIAGTNESLDADLSKATWELEVLKARKRAAQDEGDTAVGQVLDEKLAAMAEKIEDVRKSIRDLELRAPFAGSWISPHADLVPGGFVPRGQQVGVVADLNAIIIRAPADQQSAARILAQAQPRVEIRGRKRPDLFFTGVIEKIHPAGDKQLPSMALGYAVGGTTEIDTGDRTGSTSKERTFQVVIRPDPGSAVHLLSGQRVVVRFDLGHRSLARQWWEALLRLAQRRFHT